MKLLAALVMAFPLTSFAMNYAACDLYAFQYTSADWRNYKLENVERVSATWSSLSSTDVVLEDSIYPVSYSVKFSLKGTITGSLGIKIDQPGPFVSATVSTNEYLNLELEDLYNGGKTVYKLQCGLDD